MKYNPGPWEFWEFKQAKTNLKMWGIGYPNAFSEFKSVTHFCSVSSKANARLIAFAPELLETLKRVQGQLEIGNPISTNDDFHKIVKQAIAKAEGSKK